MNNRDNEFELKNRHNDIDLWAEINDLQLTTEYLFNDNTEAHLIGIDPHAPEFLESHRRTSKRALLNDLRRDMKNKPHNQSLVYGYVRLAQRPGLEGNHIGSYVIDTDNNCAVILEPFGQDTHYQSNVNEIEAALKAQFPGMTVYRNTTCFQKDGVNCGGISRDGAAYLINQCSGSNDHDRLTRAFDSLQKVTPHKTTSPFYHAWRSAQEERTANETRRLRDKQRELVMGFRDSIQNILDDLDPQIKANMWAATASQRGPTYTQIEYFAEIKKCLKDTIFHSPALKRQFLRLDPNARKNLITELCRDLTHAELVRNRHRGYDIQLSRDEMNAYRNKVNQAFRNTSRQQQAQPQPAPVQPQRVQQPAYPSSTHQVHATLNHGQQQQNKATQPPLAPRTNNVAPKPAAVVPPQSQPPHTAQVDYRQQSVPTPPPAPAYGPAPAYSPTLIAPRPRPPMFNTANEHERNQGNMVTSRTKVTTWEPKQHRIRISDGPYEIAIGMGKTSSLTISLGLQTLVEKARINFVVTHACIIQDQGQTSVIIVGLDLQARLLNLSHPEQEPVKFGPEHGSYITSVDTVNRNGQQLVISPSKASIHLYKPNGEHHKEIPIDGSRLITSAVGLDNGWIACTDRLGFLYLVDPQDNVWKYKDKETAADKRDRSNKLSALSLQDGELVQHGKDSHNPERLHFDMNKLNVNNGNWTLHTPAPEVNNEDLASYRPNGR